MIPVTSFAGRKVAVFGLGGSGLVSARALMAGGADVVASDDNADSVKKAEAAGIPIADLHAIDWTGLGALVLAPGVPLTHPAPHWSVELARKAAVPVIGDIELFCRERRRLAPAAPFVAITGTNGKSTTTALTAHLAASAGMDAQLGGNIGTAILSLAPPQAPDARPSRVHVIECSSYQIDLAPSLDPSIGILINLSEDHLDRHGTMAHYAAVKERLVAGVPPEGTTIVGVDDEWCRAIADRLAQSGKRVVRISVHSALADGIYAEGHRIMRAVAGEAMPIADIGGVGSLRGLHNVQNAACATAAALALGLSPAAIQAGLRSFPGLAHRMEEVGRSGNVLFVNDFKSDQCRLGGASACLFRRYFLDRRRQAEDRRHRIAARLLPADPQGLSDRRGGGRIRRDAGRRGRPRDNRYARQGGRRGGARCSAFDIEAAGRAAVAGLRLVRSVSQFRGARRRVPQPGPGFARGRENDRPMRATLQRSSLLRRMTRVNKLDAWLGAMLLSPRRASVSVTVSIALFCALGVLVLLLMKPAESLFMDSTEAYAWGMQFLGGYGRHPPLTGWIARVWYSVFPAAHWSSYALSELMTGVSLGSIYLIGRHALGRRRATLIVFAMMLYPLFIGAKADRFNNYQVLLAVLPLTVWLFLRAYDKPSVRSGIALGLAAAAATLTIYSAAFALIGMALAAALHPGRRLFFTSPAPYAAAVVYLLALSPHILWLIHNDFSSLRWAESFVDQVSHRAHVATYLGQHFGLVAFCLLGAAIALLPWRWRAGPIDAPPPTDRLLILIIAAALIGGPALIGLAFNVFLKPDWGNPFFFLVPIAVLSLLPSVLVTRRSVARAVVVAAIFTVGLLVGSPVYSWVRFKKELDDGVYRPFPQAAAEITRLWHDRFHSRLPIVASGFELAAPIVFYSPDHPKMFSDFDPAYAPWIDYPAELIQKGYVGVCFADDAACRAALKALNPNAEQVDIALRRQRYGLTTPPMKLHLEFTAPNP